MKRIILIDDAITDERIISNFVTNVYEITDDKQVKEVDKREKRRFFYDTHADICSKIICKYAKDVEIINLIVKEPENNGSVIGLIKALEFSEQLKADIVHLSIGTNSFLFSRRMHECIKSLTRNKKVVAAKANNNKRTFPADFIEVYGCIAGEYDEVRVLKKNNYVLKATHLIRGKDKRVFFTPNTNSYAAAYFTALCCIQSENNKTIHISLPEHERRIKDEENHEETY